MKPMPMLVQGGNLSLEMVIGDVGMKNAAE